MAARSPSLHHLTAWLLALLLAMRADAAEDSLNGFLPQPSRVPVEEILRGGPPRVGIPALDHPSMLAADAGDFRDDEWVIGIEWEGEARAYPAAELERRSENLVENFEGHPVRISYDVNRRRFEVEASPEIEVIEAYRFAWAAFHPETTV